jgi:hypothetical protein
MLERKNKRLAAMLLFWVAAIAATYWLGKSGDSQNVPKNLFNNFDVTSIDRVILSTGRDSIVLEYKGSRWLVRNRYPADPDMIDVLFATLQQATPRRPVSTSLRDSVTAQIRQNGVMVALYSSGDQIAHFMAGGNKSKTQAYFLEPASGQPYLMSIPGYRVYASGIFELPAGDWRNKRIFAFNWRNFSQLELQFPKRPNDNFVVALEDDNFGIRGMEADTTRLNDFLDGVSLLHVMEYAGQSARFDSLAKTAPLMTIVVSDVGQRSYQLDVFAPDRGQDVYPARIDGSQWAYFDRGSIGPLLRTRDFFKK